MIIFSTPAVFRPASLGKFLSILASCAVAVAPAAAQDSSEVFEEIVVHATKRPTAKMDTPIAVSILGGPEIEAAGIKDMFDLQQNVPGLIVDQSQTATTSNFAIRGIGSTSNNFGVESSVGLYVDGIYRSRQSSLINDLVDVEAVEVLRGPQGTLFGKNTAAGAILIRSVRPGQDRDAFVDLTVGDFGLVKVSAAANIPISDSMAFRGTIYSSQRDGYVDDAALGKDVFNDKDRLGVRLQLANNESGDDFSWRLIADYSEINETCCVALNRVDSLYYRGSLANPLTITNGSDAAAVALGGTVYTDFPYPQALLDPFVILPGTILTGVGFDDYLTAVNFAPISENEDMGLSLEMEWNLANGMTAKSISAFRSFETFDFIDGDFSDVDIFTRTNTAEQSSFSQEFQLSGEFGNDSRFVTGLYYFGQSLDSTTDTTGGVFFGTFIEILNPSLRDIFDNVNLLDAGLELAGLGALLNPATEAFPPGTTSFDDMRQDHSGWAAFGQVDFALSDQFTLTLGARFTDEDKDIDGRFTQMANGPPPDLRLCSAPDPLDPFNFVGGAVCVALNEAGAFLASAGAVGSLDGLLAGDLVPVSQPNVAWGSYQFDPLAPRSDLLESISDSQSTGTVKLSWLPTDSSMLYVSFATGFKSGGTNTERINPAFSSLFDAEPSESFEVGYKGEIGRAQLVVTYYQTDFDDFQAQSFTGTGFNLQNAGKLNVEGWEVELLWRPTDTLEVQAFYAKNEGEYDSFDMGTAWDTWVFHEGLWIGQGDPGCPGPLDPLNLPASCSRTGEPLPYNPEDRAFVAITQDFSVGNNTSMFIRGEFSHASEYFTDGDSDPFTLQESVDLINLRLGFNFDNIGSTLTFWGRNITDERFYRGSFDIPVTEDKMYSYPAEPATYGVTFNKRFD